jgi:hypothetical protein
VYLMVQRKEIPHIRMGKNEWICQSDLLKWLEGKIESSNSYSFPFGKF